MQWEVEPIAGKTGESFRSSEQHSHLKPSFRGQRSCLAEHAALHAVQSHYMLSRMSAANAITPLNARECAWIELFHSFYN